MPAKRSPKPRPRPEPRLPEHRRPTLGSRYDGPMFWVSAFGAGLVVVSTVFSAIGLWLVKGQLDLTSDQVNLSRDQYDLSVEQAADARATTRQAQLGEAASIERQGRLITATQAFAEAAKTQSESMAVLARANQQSARAADIAVAADQTRLRAYITAEPGRLDDFGVGPDRVGRVRMKNVGQTPAYDVTMRGNTVLIEYPNIPDPRFYAAALFAGNSSSNDAVMAPGADRVGMTSLSAVSDIQAELVRSQRLHLVTIGLVTYRDIFGKTHVSRFCYVYPRAEFGEESARFCSSGNDAD